MGYKNERCMAIGWLVKGTVGRESLAEEGCERWLHNSQLFFCCCFVFVWVEVFVQSRFSRMRIVGALNSRLRVVKRVNGKRL